MKGKRIILIEDRFIWICNDVDKTNFEQHFLNDLLDLCNDKIEDVKINALRSIR